MTTKAVNTFENHYSLNFFTMKIQKISLSFSGYSDANFATKARFILDSLTNNPLFPNPVPALANVEDAYSSYKQRKAGCRGTG
jgi:hypothetical protein